MVQAGVDIDVFYGRGVTLMDGCGSYPLAKALVGLVTEMVHPALNNCTNLKTAAIRNILWLP